MQIEKLKQSWMIGMETISYSSQVPPEWLQALNNQGGDFKLLSEQRLTLLILASQYETYVVENQQPIAFESQLELPALSLPILNEHLRPLFTRSLERLGQYDNGGIAGILYLLASRGYCAHPIDYMPKANDEHIPDVYMPWQKWLSKHSLQEIPETFSEENWDSYFPAERLRLLKKMRRESPEKARDILEACMHKESADKRVKLLSCLAINLQEEDAEYLRSFQSDRSKKVSTLAFQYLARLDLDRDKQATRGTDNQHSDISEEDSQDLLRWYEVKTQGLFKRRHKLLPSKLKNNKQMAMRTALIARLPLWQIAACFDMPLEGLVNAWSFSKNRFSDNLSFVENAANTLPQSLLDILLDNLLEELNDSENLFSLLGLFTERLSDEAKAQLLVRLFQSKKYFVSFQDAVSLLKQPVSSLSSDVILDSQAWSNLKNSIESDLKENTYLENYECLRELNALGILLTQSVAKHVLDVLNDSHLLNADPALDLLKLNTQLASTP